MKPSCQPKIIASGLFAGPLASLSPGAARAGDTIFVTNNHDGTIGEYTTSGATLNAALISGLDDPLGVAVSGSDLFVINFAGDTVGEYTTAGATVNAALISGLDGPAGIAITGSSVPEASTWAMALTGFAALAFAGFRRARSRGAAA
jgi:PEP-CTERM motif